MSEIHERDLRRLLETCVRVGEQKSAEAIQWREEHRRLERAAREAAGFLRSGLPGRALETLQRALQAEKISEQG